MAIPERIIEEAQAVVGLCACGPYREQFRAFLGPCAPGWRWDLARPFRQWRDEHGTIRTQGVSTCAIATERIWRAAGVAVPQSWEPYAGGTFVRTHAWPAAVRALGDMRVLPPAGSALWTAGHFIACVESWVDPWDVTLPYQDCYTIDGGQVCLEHGGGHEGIGLQRITRKRRRYWPALGLLAEVNPEGGHGLRSRVLGWVDVERLPMPGQ